MFYGQHQEDEDEYIKQIFPEGYTGTCVDVGARDGMGMSNTLYFEQQGWRCLCIEPVETAFQKCALLRKECVRCCVGDKDYPEGLEFTTFFLGDNTSAISSLSPDERLIIAHDHLITDKKIGRVPVRSLTTLLDE